jgi:hypothetical protein
MKRKKWIRIQQQQRVITLILVIMMSVVQYMTILFFRIIIGYLPARPWNVPEILAGHPTGVPFHHESVHVVDPE